MMKKIRCGIGGLAVLMAGCATRYFPGELVSVNTQGAPSPAFDAQKNTSNLDEQAAIRLLSPNDKLLLAAIRATEAEHGFRSLWWSIEEGTLRYNSFRAGQPTEKAPPIWLRVDWRQHKIQVFATDQTEQMKTIATRLSERIRQQDPVASVSITEHATPIRPSLFGP